VIAYLYVSCTKEYVGTYSRGRRYPFSSNQIEERRSRKHAVYFSPQALVNTAYTYDTQR